jgi:hypothetical protein
MARGYVVEVDRRRIRLPETALQTRLGSPIDGALVRFQMPRIAARKAR